MAVKLNAYLSFKSNAREAMEFYREVFGGELSVQTFKDLNASQDPAEDELVMHSQLDGDHGIVFMASDTPNRMEFRPGTNFNMSLSGDDQALLSGYFDKLSSQGNVTMPLAKALWGDTFGMCVDRFGVSWLVNIAGG
ncbi:MAG: VOC family protein [Candidatus Dormibacteria bacterium]